MYRCEKKAYGNVWRDCLWLKLRDVGVRGRMWRGIETMWEASRSAVFLEGEKSVQSKVWHKVVAYPPYYILYG